MQNAGSVGWIFGGSLFLAVGGIKLMMEMKFMYCTVLWNCDSLTEG